MSRQIRIIVIVLSLSMLLIGCGKVETIITPTSILPTKMPLPSSTTVVVPAETIEAPTPKPGSALEVPQGNPPTLDGLLSPDEWGSALRQNFTDNGELFLMQSGSFLYLGMHENIYDFPVTSVCLEHEDEISILHSSASLGSVTFKRNAKGWQLSKPFNWQLYQVTSSSPADEQKRKTFLENNGWLANLGSMTDTEEIEYQITIPDGPFRIAVAYLLPTNRDKAAGGLLPFPMIAVRSSSFRAISQRA
jgi:hypothetical protein